MDDGLFRRELNPDGPEPRIDLAAFAGGEPLMSRDSQIDSYLDAVTSSLAGDEEVRLDVRAELAAHLDEAAAINPIERLHPP